jgi:GNAT superfamily N-acetyltransferase
MYQRMHKLEKIVFSDLQADHELKTATEKFVGGLWPTFMQHSKSCKDNWPLIASGPASKYHIIAIKNGAINNEIVGCASAVPLPDIAAEKIGTKASDGGWDEALAIGAKYVTDITLSGESSPQPTTMCALSVTVALDYRGTGLAGKFLATLCHRAKSAGFKAMRVPLRPTMRSRYPLQSFEQYCGWQRSDGLPFDPWLRTHVKMGAEIVKIASHSTDVVGSVAEWERWTKMTFPASGDYWIPEGLAPLRVNIEKDFGQYIEPNLWVMHPLSQEVNFA